MHNLLRSFRDAFAGLAFCFATQRNMGIHAAVGALVMVFAFLLRVTALEAVLLLSVICAVLVAETFNTAVEKAVDLATRDRSSLAHIAKDVAAGAVLLTALLAVLVGLIILGPRVWQLFGQL
jgi:diacylglycerol kinase (ATP)